MPYNIAEDAGGDSATNVAKMERCVSRVMARDGVPEKRAIAICKASIQNAARRKRKRKHAR